MYIYDVTLNVINIIIRQYNMVDLVVVDEDGGLFGWKEDGVYSGIMTHTVEQT